MDVDEVDGLCQSFGRITTADADSLICQFRQILNESYGELSKETCAFFLDMNNWNLPAALGCFYDYDAQDMLNVPQMTFVNDVTVGEDEIVSPNTPFLKTWRLLNSGKDRWPDGCTLRRVQGNGVICQNSYISVQSALPGQIVHVSVHMISPSNPGVYQSLWRLTLSSEVPFGDQIWCIITVEEHAVMDVTQRLANTRCFADESSSNEKPTAGSSPNLAESAPPTFERTTDNKPFELKNDFARLLDADLSKAPFLNSSVSTSLQRPSFISPVQQTSAETKLEASFQSGDISDSTEFTRAPIDGNGSKGRNDANMECASRAFFS